MNPFETERFIPVVSGKKKQYQELPTIDRVLTREEDLRFLDHELGKFQQSLFYDRTVLQIISIFDQYVENKKMIQALLYRSLYTGSLETVDQDILKVPKPAIQQILTLQNVLNTKKTVYLDEDHEAILDLIKEDPQISPLDLLREKVRTSKEDCELLGMQVGDLRKQEKAIKKAEKRKKNETFVQIFPAAIIQEKDAEETIIQEEILESIRTEAPFLLKDWDISWTSTPYSVQENHLQKIPSESRSDAVRAVQEVGRGKISISPSSIVRALEFYLQKDVIQKALSIKNKYASEESRDWIKIKRGKDRIMLNPSEEEKKLIFFAAGRDVVYRRL